MSQPTEIINYSPATGAEVGRYPNTSAATIDELVTRANIASQNWRGLGFEGRKAILRSWAHYLSLHIDELASIVSQETGKPISDAALEISIAIEHLSWAARKAERYLRNSHRTPGLLMANMSAHVEYQPLGVIGDRKSVV